MNGFEIFENLLASRGAHYKTKYTLQISAADYKGKRVKHPIKCESHQRIFQYSMQERSFQKEDFPLALVLCVGLTQTIKMEV
jgi:hypothetical protein